MPDGDDFTTRYRLLHRLGSGGMGTVWLARDEMLDREVAVKELTPPPGMSEAQRAEAVARAVREAQATAQLRHPAVVAVHDVAVHDGKPWIVMELLRGRTLAEFVKERGPLPPEQAAALGAQLLDGLDAAHARGIQHRDVKPGNVFLTDSGRVVLTDFGIARFAGDTTLTQADLLIGSPGFIAPERLDGEPGGPASDLWSLGATLYLGAEGVPAIEGEAMVRLSATLSGRIRPPHRSGALGPVLTAMMARHPAQRPDAQTLRGLLAQVAAGHTPQVPPPSSVLPPPPRPHEQVHGLPSPQIHGHPVPQAQGHPASQAHGHPVPHHPGPGPQPPYAPGPPSPHGHGPQPPHGHGPQSPHGAVADPHGSGAEPDASGAAPVRRRGGLRLWAAVAAVACVAGAGAGAALALTTGPGERTSFDEPVDFCKLLTAEQVRQIMGVAQPPAGRPDDGGCAWTTEDTGIALIPVTDSDTPQPWALTPESARTLFANLDREHAKASQVNWEWKEIGVSGATAERTVRRAVPGLGEEAFAYDLTSSGGRTHSGIVTFRLLDLVVEAQYSTRSSRPTDDDVRNGALAVARQGEASLRGLK
ncbi:serine/threonine protein kinase [Planomonospora sp. ID91781]|uniref:serine/threonine-protein kinase n=1 Tax=Planomonospora sp. ID91781 TaxID=2738135 RepID=UPI0018C37663|nr:serine/threonine-protein kinase [Planomonospora sp. ID91781]MBG0825221.1 serine/threonine protein kinase [Planomonospora sp. ID91781]